MEYTLDDFFKENPKGANAILITRLSKEKADLIKEVHDDMDYRPEARIGIVGNIPEPDGMGNILIATGGTSDIPVAEEAAVTAALLSMLNSCANGIAVVNIDNGFRAGTMASRINHMG